LDILGTMISMDTQERVERGVQVHTHI